MDRTVLTLIIADGVRFDKAHLRGSWWKHSSFRNSSLIGADLRAANLDVSGWRNCDFGGANLAGAKLGSATFDGCIFDGGEQHPRTAGRARRA